MQSRSNAHFTNQTLDEFRSFPLVGVKLDIKMANCVFNKRGYPDFTFTFISCCRKLVYLLILSRNILFLVLSDD